MNKRQDLVWPWTRTAFQKQRNNATKSLYKNSRRKRKTPRIIEMNSSVASSFSLWTGETREMKVKHYQFGFTLCTYSVFSGPQTNKQSGYLWSSFSPKNLFCKRVTCQSCLLQCKVKLRWMCRKSTWQLVRLFSIFQQGMPVWRVFGFDTYFLKNRSLENIVIPSLKICMVVHIII